MKTTISCDLKLIEGIAWDQITSEVKDKIWECIRSAGWHGDSPRRFGFVGERRINDVLGAFFELEYGLEIRQFDDEKNLSQKEEPCFERILVVLFVDKGWLLIQQKKFMHRQMMQSTMEHYLKEALKKVFYDCGMSTTFSLSDVRLEIRKERFLEIYEKHPVYRLKVRGLKDARLPPDQVYFNPEVDRNAILRESQEHDFRQLDSVTLEAYEPAEGDLREVHFAQGAIKAGQPEEMKALVERKKVTYRRSFTEDLEYYVDLDAESVAEEDLRQIIGDIDTQTEGWWIATRRGDESTLPLFDRGKE